MREYVMYVAAIKLPPGKLAAQVSHAVLNCYIKGMNFSRESKMALARWLCIEDYIDGGFQTKVILKLENEEQFEKITDYCQAYEIPYSVIQDAGRTVVKPGTKTAIAWGPILKEEAGPWKTMKLY